MFSLPKLPRLPLMLWTLLALCILPELLLQGSDLGLWGSPSWRGLAYAWFGFWPGLLHDWRPNYAPQPWAMFVTYGFLHGGLLHLVVNMMTLVSLGRAVTERVGQRSFLLIYTVSLLGGGLGFGLLTNTTIPMVGASGALFGLVGAVITWALRDRRRESLTLWPVARALIWLVALNLLLWFATGGQLAWQTHLGGFVAGAVLGMVLE